MNQENTADMLHAEEPKKLPTGLNVLTILTFIGCAFETYSTVNNFMTGKKALDEMEKAQEKLAEAPSWAKKFAGPEVQEMMTKAYENRIPLLVLGLVAIALCLYGAIQMRKMKKEGYTLWLIGELLPYIGSAILLPVFFKTIFVYFAIIPVLFIIMYTIQRKHLVN
ncbi:MAG TPA: hypothetical protein PLZ45_13945 [Ferruginibacter sp.]|nr:hypothetical protein [Ferruginibacter sp.]